MFAAQSLLVLVEIPKEIMIIALPDILKLQSKHVTQPHLCYLNYAVSQPLPLTSPLPSQRPPQFPEHVTSSRAVTVPLIWLSRLDRPLRPPGPLASKSPPITLQNGGSCFSPRAFAQSWCSSNTLAARLLFAFEINPRILHILYLCFFFKNSLFWNCVSWTQEET